MIKKIYGKHTFYFSLLTIGLSILALLTKNFFSSLDESVVLFVCLFFILSIGISHGALDNYKADKLLTIYKINNKAIFFGVYTFISVLVIFIWSLYSTFTLLAFLFVASYHFGLEDTSFLHKGNTFLDQIFYLIKGSLIVFAPIFFHFDETLKIFETLMLGKTFLTFLEYEHWIINVCLFFSIVGYFYFIFKNQFKDFEILLLDMFSIIILNFIFSPLIAFTVYFCFLHSIRHIISLSYELNKNDFSNGIKVFVKKALPLTVVTIIFYLIAVVFLSKSYGLNEVIIKVIFIGLASLTFPHILLEYLLEINEKRN